MTKPMYATRAFKDAGTDREFADGEHITGVDAGTLSNYRAAGLAGPQDSEADKLVAEIASDDAAAAAAAGDADAPSAKPAPRKRTRSKATSKSA